jgi:hypothetical protein
MLENALKVYEKHSRIKEICENRENGVFRMLVGYMRVSSENDRQNTDLTGCKFFFGFLLLWRHGRLKFGTTGILR